MPEESTQTTPPPTEEASTPEDRGPGLLEQAMDSVKSDAEVSSEGKEPQDFLSGIEKSFDAAISKGKIEPPKEKPQEAAPETEAPKPKSEASTTEDYPTPEEAGLEGAAKAKWGELRNELYATRDELKALKEQGGARPDATTAAEIERLRKEHEAATERIQKYEQELSISRIEATPEFEKAVTEPLAAIVDLADGLAKAHDIDPDRLIAAISESDSARQSALLSEVVEGMPERDRARVYRMADDTAAILQREAQLKENAAHALEESETRKQQEQQIAHRRHQEAVGKAIDRVAEMLAARIPKVEGLDMASLIEEAKTTDYAKTTPDVQGYSIVAGATLPHLVKTMHQQAARIAELEQNLKAVHGATPSAGAGQRGDRSQVPDDVGFLDAVFRAG